MGARIFNFPWRDDFAQARNFALSQATGEWIVFLDADEKLVFPQGKSLREILSHASITYEALLLKLVNVDVEAGNSILDFFYTVRIFRNQMNLCYKGAVHEQLFHQDGRLLSVAKVGEEQIFVQHTGYSKERIRKKCVRNIRLLQQQIDLVDRSIKNYYHLAESYVSLEQPTEALPYLRRIKGFLPQGWTYKSRYYQMYLTSLQACGLYAGDEYLDLLKDAMKICPELPDFHAEYAQVLYTQHKYQKAWQEINTAIELHKVYNGMEPSFFGEMLEQAVHLKRRIEAQMEESKKNLCREQAKALANEAQQALAEDLRELFCCLLCLSEKKQRNRYIHMLPSSMQQILEVYFEGGTIREIDLYHSLKPYIKDKVDQEIFNRYDKLAE